MATSQNSLTRDSLQIVTAREAGAILGLSTSTLAKFRCTGRGPRYVSLSPTRIGYRLSDLHSWIEANLKRSTSDTQGARP